MKKATLTVLHKKEIIYYFWFILSTNQHIGDMKSNTGSVAFFACKNPTCDELRTFRNEH